VYCASSLPLDSALPTSPPKKSIIRVKPDETCQIAWLDDLLLAPFNGSIGGHRDAQERLDETSRSPSRVIQLIFRV
jgi:hypothetical protein